MASGFTQPLSFIDATVDSIKAVASHVNPTSDDGWVVSAVVNDSIVQFSKFDYCGKLEWNKWVYAKGSIRNSATAFLQIKSTSQQHLAMSREKEFLCHSDERWIIDQESIVEF